MIDPKIIRENPKWVKAQLDKRSDKFSDSFNHYVNADQQWREQLIIIDHLKMKRNQLTPKGKPTEEQLQALKELSKEIKQKQEHVQELEHTAKQLAMQLPNIPSDSVPVGIDDTQNEFIKKVGDPKQFSFKVKSHEECGSAKNGLNFNQGAVVTGSRFTIYQHHYAMLERALLNLMLDTHVYEHQYEEVLPPVIVNSASLEGTGQLPKFKDDLFKIQDTDYWLSSTAEVQLTNLYRNHIFKQSELPKKVTAGTACFRKEAGSYGKDIKGIIRQHQFNKVELVQFVEPEKSDQALQELLGHAETILNLLELPYQVVKLCSGDLGFSAAITFDIEVWFPSQNKYREISSCSNFQDFQSRRAMIRYKKEGSSETNYVHTINGSGLAVGRTLAAIIENYQQEDGSILVPNVLKKYIRLEYL